jgi:hypothetical protein
MVLDLSTFRHSLEHVIRPLTVAAEHTTHVPGFDVLGMDISLSYDKKRVRARTGNAPAVNVYSHEVRRARFESPHDHAAHN